MLPKWFIQMLHTAWLIGTNGRDVDNAPKKRLSTGTKGAKTK
jgi:hypothetical protein